MLLVRPRREDSQVFAEGDGIANVDRLELSYVGKDRFAIAPAQKWNRLI